MSVANPAKTPRAKGFRDLLSVEIRRVGGEESVDNEMPVC
jgi:hypothetical protein